MKRLALAIAISLSVIVSGCETFPKNDIEIATEADPKTNFGGYKTYAWLGSAQILNDPEGNWEPPGFDADSFITTVVDRELANRGMTQTTRYPDMLLAYALGVDTAMMKVQEDPEAQLTVLENVPSGALVIVMMDPETEFVTWAGVAVAELQNQGDEIAKKRIDYAITQMFKQMPK
jgi:hypothetical protein